MRISIFFQTIILISIILLITNCQTETQIETKYIIVGPINKVLILGNSITITRPVPEIGWNAHWGMAASSEENDYVHLLIDKFKKYNDSVEVRYASVSNFEREFWNYDYSQLDGFRSFVPDLIIIRLGDNVDDTEATNRRFDDHLFNFISYLKNGKRTAICTTSTFWPSKPVNEQIRSLSMRENYIYVSIDDLVKDPTNKAIGKFSDPDVAEHPSDKGMLNIANRISDKLGIF
jgi:hypothetical protein